MAATPWILLVALASPAVYAFLLGPLLLDSGLEPVTESVLGLLYMWLIAVVVITLVSRAERMPLSSIGLRRPSLRGVLAGLGIGVVLSVAVPALSLLGGLLFPALSAEGTGSIASAAENPWWLILAAVVTAGVTEEILFRGYALERLHALTGSKLLSSVVAIASFSAAHLVGWNIAHVVTVVVPLGTALTALYWWKRDLVMLVVAHIVIDLPLVFIAMQQ